MKRSSEHWKGVIDVSESNGNINDGIGGHVDYVRCKKQPKLGLDQKEDGDPTGACIRSPE
jgi:hypothetical protein